MPVEILRAGSDYCTARPAYFKICVCVEASTKCERVFISHKNMFVVDTIRNEIGGPRRSYTGQSAGTGCSTKYYRSSCVYTDDLRRRTYLAEKSPNACESSSRRYSGKNGIHFAMHLAINLWS